MRSATGPGIVGAGLALPAAGYARAVSEVTITVRPNGPYKVVGPITVVDVEGRPVELPEGTAVALCRCGHSQTKPFCDSSHKRVGFVADDVAPRVDQSAIDSSS